MKISAFIRKALNEVFYRIVRVKSCRVYFNSFSGHSYSDNPRYISEALHKLDPNIEIVWGFKNPREKQAVVPPYVKCIDSNNRLSSRIALYSSAVIVDNCSLPFFRKSPKQFLIQTWHGDRAFKKVLLDSPFASKDYFVPESIEGFCDLAIAGSEYGKQQYLSAFKFKGEILMEGTPRNDLLVDKNDETIRKIKNEIGLPLTKKVFMYAPTLRRENATHNTAQESRVDIYKTLNDLEAATGEEWVCLMRAHPSVCDLCGVEYNDRILNVSGYEDMAQLLLISDMLITDYSSCAGDFALLGKPVILFHSDIKSYLEKDRDFYFEISDSPYYVADSQEELDGIIFDLPQRDVEANCREILDFYGTNESGKASEIVAKRIIDWMKT